MVVGKNDWQQAIHNMKVPEEMHCMLFGGFLFSFPNDSDGLFPSNVVDVRVIFMKAAFFWLMKRG